LVPDAHAWLLRANLATALCRNSGWENLEYDWIHRDGHLVTMVGTAKPIRDPAGAVVGYRGSRRPVTPAMTAAQNALAATGRISEVLKAATVGIALQPIVSLVDGRLAGAEALTRFGDRRPPDVWFAEAHGTGQSVALGLLAFTSALKLLPSLPSSAYLSVNVTPELITDPGLQRALLDADVPIERVVLELTEYVAVESYRAMLAVLAPLRERGLRLTVDDIGAGYASFSHVLQLRPDIIKIDRSLINQIAGDPAKQALVASLVLFARQIDAAVTAEGVETPEELEMITSLGVGTVQGYLIARPGTDRTTWATWWDRAWLRPSLPARAVRAAEPLPRP
jgi:EAL domain-containing protein (putative c-di-GMP-specific phosphodiesterase class I)